MYAIIETGGKQYRATAGDVLFLEKLQGNNGEMITFDKVLLIGGKTDKNVLVGKPYVASAKLQAEIVDQDSRGEKLLTIKYKRRKRYRRTIGHRQELTRVLVTKVEDGQGGSFEYDSAKRNEILMDASVKFSNRTEERRKERETAGAKTAAAKKPAAKSTARKTKA
ncbi:MAG: 50S ribosomal protein L21 [Deltaproteobacteria bacterium]|nr:50S ribosomal protein L21 [Deltaproteobacteria bacterium]